MGSFVRVWPADYNWHAAPLSPPTSPAFSFPSGYGFGDPSATDVDFGKSSYPDHNDIPSYDEPRFKKPEPVRSSRPNYIEGYGDGHDVETFGAQREYEKPTTYSATTPAYYLPWLVSMTWLAGGGQSQQLNGEDSDGGGRLKEVFAWNTVDFAYPDKASRDAAIKSKAFVPEANLPLGLEVYGGRVFVTLPKWKTGTPATLATFPVDSTSKSPVLQPYPSWDWHVPGKCDGMVTVFRLNVDDCGRLWVVDTGSEDILGTLKRTCPPKILVFDLKTDKLIVRYELPTNQVKEGSLFTNIIADVLTCQKTFAYVSDVFRFGLVVYDLAQNKSWRVENPYFFPEPLKSVYHHDGLTWRWTDGVFGLALSPIEGGSRYLYLHAMSSWREFRVQTSVLHNETTATQNKDAVELLGSRRRSRGNASGQSMDKNGVLFYNLIVEDAVGCWNSNSGPYTPQNQGIVDQSKVTLNFPNDLKVDHEPEQSVWVLSNKLHKFLYSTLNPNEPNTRILTMKTSEAVRGTICEYGGPSGRITRASEKPTSRGNVRPLRG